MKFTGFSRLIVMTLGATSMTMVASGAHAAACVQGTLLHGYYGILVAGESLSGSYGKYLSGSLYFNGACGITAQHLNGGVNGNVSVSTATGKYVVGPRQVISISLKLSGESYTESFAVGVSTQSGGAYGLETDGSAVATITLQPQPAVTGGYSTSALKGTYQLSCIGTNDSFSDLNTMTFDGAGNLSGYDVYNNSGDEGTAPITGTYTAYSDGTFSATLNNNFAGYSVTGVLANGIHSMMYTYSVAGTGGVVGCTGAN